MPMTACATLSPACSARHGKGAGFHWIRNALAHVPKGQHAMVAAAIRQPFLQADAEAAHRTWRHVADHLRPRWPKLTALMGEREHDVLAYKTFPAQHRTKLHSTNPLERLNKEAKRRADVVGIFPNEASIVRLIGAVLLEQNNEWLLRIDRFRTPENLYAAASSTRRGEELKTENRM
jgi:transposase-like protein